MTADDFAEGASFMGRSLPPAFQRREVILAPGEECPFVEAEWHDAIVVVQRGAIELDCVAGSARSFAEGSMMSLSGLPLRALCNRGAEPATVVAVSRRR